MDKLLVVMIPVLPLLACLITATLGPRVLKEKSHWPAILGCGLACVCSLIALCFVWGIHDQQPAGRTYEIYRWIAIPSSGTVPALDVPISLRLDSLSAIMLSMVTFVSTLVAIYAAGYMHGERGYWRFFSEVSLFVFSMIMLVLSANFLQMYMFWEAVGLCSYLLIGFWYEKPSAAAAGIKAFVVNRIGDFGFAIGVFLLWTTFGTLEFDRILIQPQLLEAKAAKLGVSPEMIELICLCLFMGAVGKSAQFPLHVWLPDAMEGPTPVSALIHAATMVTAGVYMVARCTPLFMLAPQAQLVVSIIGGFTALLAALIALTQTDLKRVLAYSTVSQLGYMFLGLGTGTYLGIAGAMFHLVTHAFFKALLFLGAGSVMHAMGGVIDMRRFSGLRRVMPTTYWTFLIGSLALAGVAPLSGFWSKDTILAAVNMAGHADQHAGGELHGSGDTRRSDDDTGNEFSVFSFRFSENSDKGAGGGVPVSAVSYRTLNTEHRTPLSTPTLNTAHRTPVFGMRAAACYRVLYWMATVTAFLTAFYTFRAFLMTFHGPERIPDEAGHHAHESPPMMTLPLMILAVGAAFLGLALGHAFGLFDTFLNLTIHGVGEHHAFNWMVASVSLGVAVLGIALAWVLYGKPSSLPERIAASVRPLTSLSEHKFYLDELYLVGVVLPLRGLAQISRFVDWIIVDGAFVGLFTRLPRDLGKLARPIQNGLVQFYALSMMLAMAVLMWALLALPRMY